MGPAGSCHEQIENVRERKIRRSLVRKERALVTCEDKSGMGVNGIAAVGPAPASEKTDVSM